MDDKTKEGKGVPFVKGSETSTAAADSLIQHSKTVEIQVLGLFMDAANFGLTDDEIEQSLGLKHQTVSARRRQLEKKGLVVKMYNHGQRVKRPTRSGRQAGVYISRRAYDKSHDPVVNTPILYCHLTTDLEQQLRFLRNQSDRYIAYLDGSNGEIKNACQDIENMVNKLSCILDDVKTKARRLWKKQHQQDQFPQ